MPLTCSELECEARPAPPQAGPLGLGSRRGLFTLPHPQGHGALLLPGALPPALLAHPTAGARRREAQDHCHRLLRGGTERAAGTGRGSSPASRSTGLGSHYRSFLLCKQYLTMEGFLSMIALECKDLIGSPFAARFSTPSPRSTLSRLPPCPGNPQHLLGTAMCRAPDQSYKVGGTNMKLTLPSPQGILSVAGKPEDAPIIKWGAMECLVL